MVVARKPGSRRAVLLVEEAQPEKRPTARIASVAFVEDRLGTAKCYNIP
jgi:hypothetical protein